MKQLAVILLTTFTAAGCNISVGGSDNNHGNNIDLSRFSGVYFEGNPTYSRTLFVAPDYVTFSDSATDVSLTSRSIKVNGNSLRLSNLNNFSGSANYSGSATVTFNGNDEANFVATYNNTSLISALDKASNVVDLVALADTYQGSNATLTVNTNGYFDLYLQEHKLLGTCHLDGQVEPRNNYYSFTIERRTCPWSIESNFVGFNIPFSTGNGIAITLERSNNRFIPLSFTS
uniref:hypothetical protein n=1 Tax=Thaumasiovibrio occultus TaxID=1891184 RepID=UPI000B358AEE|nr:hypothetical protein [Thaumasiovibrio occultus]